MPVPLEDLKQAECPVSIISRFPQIDMLVTEVIRMTWAHSATGAVPFGHDTAKWPARWVDAVTQAEFEDNRLSKAVDQIAKMNRNA